MENGEFMKKKLALIIAICVFALGAIISGSVLINHRVQANKAVFLNEEAAAMMETPEPVPSPAASPTEETAPQPSEEAPAREVEPEPTQPQLMDWCKRLVEKYPDLVGWITVGDDIYLPVVQSDDNEYYLDHAIDGSENRYGAVFMDYMNDPVGLRGNTYLYGHHYQYDDTMFAPLEKYNDEKYALSHPTFTYSSLYHVYECEIFSVYLIYPDDWRIYAVNFDSWNDYQSWLDERVELSEYDFGLKPDIGDRVISLSTCDYTFSYARLIIHAVLKEIK